ncbi:MAG: Methionine--tRNA ligase [bacterium ADurb.Bin212]|nr:MAG: Methionine--tRNA ligase [bacterium ADurb.Bin212]
MSENKTVYITTAIDYVNSIPHVGHAVEKIQADVLARQYRQKNDVFFLSGVDENSLKNVLAAKKAGMDTADFVAKNSSEFEGLKELLNLSYDKFIHTTSKQHFDGCKKMWQALKPEDLYKKNYKGYYCVGCEEFKTEADLCDGKCPEHDSPLEIVEEENYFFKLSNYQEKLLELIENDEIEIIPSFRRNETLSFIRGGLEDFSVSRSKERAQNWGVPVPGDEDQIMYVWVDALANYITALGYSSDDDEYKKFWLNGDNITHMIGKGIMRFHAVYWIALLLSAGLRLPKKIYVHEYLTIDGKKMSKSIGNVIFPQEIIDRYGRDATRYILLSSLPYNSDGDLTWEKMDAKYTADLCNGIGNLNQRVLSMINRYGIELHTFESDPINTAEYIEKFKFAEGLEQVINSVGQVNRMIDDEKPWEKIKSGENKAAEATLNQAYSELKQIASSLDVFMPETAEKMKIQLETLKPEPLFPRIES